MNTLSVVIPTLNEAQTLPGLLDALAAQTRPPDEIIIADAGSTDETVQLAQARGVVVVPGGRPARGRNAGAAAASGDLIFFLDADVLPPPGFIAAFLAEFEAKGYAAATCLMEPLSDSPADHLLTDGANLYLQLVHPIVPHAPGFCILIWRRIHEQIGGFSEEVVLAEDHDYAQRAARVGKFGLLTGLRIPVSVRRLEKEGVVRLALKYLYCEIHALAGQPIRSIPFVYEFGNFTTAEPRRLVDIGLLRSRLGRLKNPLASLSEAGRASLQALTTLPPRSVEAFEQRLRSLMPADLQALQAYLRRRQALLRLTTRRLRDKIKDSPREIIKFLEGKED